MRLTVLCLSLPLLLVACEEKPSGDDTNVDSGGILPDSGSPNDVDNDGYDFDSDCNDNDASINPGAQEECDGVDQDCDNEIDEGVQETFYADGDGDGYGRTDTTVTGCEPPRGYVGSDDDCDDNDATVYPDALELCDDIDNDCDGSADEDTTETEYFADTDGDGYGDPQNTISACGAPAGYVDNAMDCDDGDVLEPVHVAEGGWSGPDTGWGSWGDSGALNFPGSPTNPFGTVQDGIDQARVCVHVHAGSYEENIDFNGKDVEVIGVDGAEATVISGLGNGSTVTFANGESSDAVLRGFTITGGAGTVEPNVVEDPECSSYYDCTTTTYNYLGGGIYVSGASPTLTELIVTQNTLPPYSHTVLSEAEEVFVYSFGGGIYLRDAAVSIEDVVVSENFADDGGGLFAEEDTYVSLRWLVFDANSASAGGGASSEGSLTGTNSVFVYNIAEGTSGYGGAGLDVSSGSASLTNVTFSGNDGLASLYLGDSATGTVLNSILVNNSVGYVIDGSSTATLGITYSDVYGGAQGNYGTLTDMTGSGGNISDDPAFASATGDWATDDLRLLPRSPAVDAGDAAARYNDADGTRNDMGAYGGPDGGW